jgi:GTP-binding protein HflX
MTNANVLSYDQLFATLDSTTRKFTLPEGREITLSDTVGFIQKLPTTLIEAFKSTLDEIVGAGLILHVIDASASNYQAQMQSVENTLEQIGAQAIKRIEVFNKIDLLTLDEREAIQKRHCAAIMISALDGKGIESLIKRIARVVSAQDSRMNILIPFDRGDLVSLAHTRGHVIREKHDKNGTLITMHIGSAYLNQFEPFSVE